ncbi:MAG: hypothetical protein ACYC6B_02655 [Thermoleophilia bacterium]
MIAAETFLQKDTAFWTALQAIGVCTSAIIVALTGFLIYRQVRVAARAFQFEGIRHLQEIVDSFRLERTQFFESFPIGLALTESQFANKPPKRHTVQDTSEGERRKMLLTEEQQAALSSLAPEQLSLARILIAKLNDIGQLAEDGFVDRHVLMGKYHTMIIRLCNLLEPVRRNLEEQYHGGSYGQRLLRMRRSAVSYNRIMPKHREVDVLITTGNGSKIILPATKGNIGLRIWWWSRRIFRLY